MFYSCWSFAITLTTWSGEKDRHAVPRWDMIQTMLITVWQKLCTTWIFFSPSFSSLLKHCIDGIGGNLRILDKFVKFLQQFFVLLQSFCFGVAGFNSSFQCVNSLRKLTEEMKFIAIFFPAPFLHTLSNWAAVNKFFFALYLSNVNTYPQKNNSRTRRQGTYCAIHLQRIVLVRPIMWTERMWIWWREWKRREKKN